MKTYYLAVDLKDDKDLIDAYEAHHKNVSLAIIESITSSGIVGMDIYRTGNRLFMVMTTTDEFSFDEKGKADASNPAVQAWEKLMDTYQQRLPWSAAGEKWVLMEKIFELPI